MSDEGKKDDREKTRLDLISPWAMEGLGQVLTYGARKYDDNNWRKGMKWSRLIGAAKRHLAEFEKGVDIDPESGMPHIDHAMACIHFLSEYQKLTNGTDDRWGKDLPAEDTLVKKIKEFWDCPPVSWGAEVISTSTLPPQSPSPRRRRRKLQRR